MIPNKKNILVLTELVQGGELSATVTMVETLLDSYNLKMFLIAFGNNFTDKTLLFDHVVIMQHSNKNKPMSFLKNIFIDFKNTYNQINSLSSKTKIDIVITTNYLMMLAAAICLRKIYVKRVFYFHGIKHTPFVTFFTLDYRQKLITLLEKIALLTSSLIVVPSAYSKDYINKFVHPFIVKNIQVVPNLISESFFSKHTTTDINKYRKRLGLLVSEDIILYSGRIVPYKGLENLIEGFNILLKDKKNTRLVLAYPSKSSDKHLIDGINTKICKLNINKYVFQIKDLNKEELSKLYSISSVTILPSELEFAPLSILESMASGTPAISTNTGNAKIIISSVDSKLIMKNNKSTEIYNKLKYVFSLSRVQKQKLSERSVKTALLYGKQKQNINLFI